MPSPTGADAEMPTLASTAAAGLCTMPNVGRRQTDEVFGDALPLCASPRRDQHTRRGCKRRCRSHSPASSHSGQCGDSGGPEAPVAPVGAGCCEAVLDVASPTTWESVLSHNDRMWLCDMVAARKLARQRLQRRAPSRSSSAQTNVLSSMFTRTGRLRPAFGNRLLARHPQSNPPRPTPRFYFLEDLTRSAISRPALATDAQTADGMLRSFLSGCTGELRLVLWEQPSSSATG